MKVAIIGGGSIGLLTAAYLKKAGYTPVLYVRREEQAESLKNQGLRLQASGQTHTFPVEAHLLSVHLPSENLIVITVKQYDIPNVVKTIKARKENVFLFLQNGMGHLRYIESLQGTVYVGTVEHGALRLDDTTVKHTGIGRVRISLFKGHGMIDQAFLLRLSENGFPVHVVDDWWQMLSEKLVVNAVINPLTALYQVKNGQLLEVQEFLTSMKAIFDETLNALGLAGREQLWELVVSVCKKTAENDSSMLKDVLEHRQTEIEAISGYVIARAEARNIEVPITKFLYNSIIGIQRLGRGQDG